MRTRRLTPLISLLFIAVLIVSITSLALTQLPLQQTTTTKYVLSPDVFYEGRVVKIFGKDTNNDNISDIIIVKDNYQQIIYKGDNATEAFYVALEKLKKETFYIGKIVFDGHFIFDKRLVIPKYSRLTIEGYGLHETILEFNTSYMSFERERGAIEYISDVFVQDVPFTVTGQEYYDYSQYLYIHDLTIKVDDPYLTAIFVEKAARFQLENVRIKGAIADPDGSYASAGVEIYNSALSDFYILKHIVISNFDYGMRLRGDHILAFSIEIAKCYIGLDIGSGVHLFMQKVHLYNINDKGIILGAMNYAIIEDISLETVGSTAIYVPYPLTGTEIRHIRMQNVVGALFGGSGASTLILEGYPFEVSGTATIPAGTTSMYIEHDLSVVTPNIVLVTLNDTIAYAVRNINATHFEIVLNSTPSTPVLVYWHAEYKP